MPAGTYKRTPEIRDRVSQGLKRYIARNGHPLAGIPLTSEHRAKISASHKGKKLSEEGIQKLKGRTPWNKGKKMSPEHRRKMSEVNTGRIPWNKGLKGYRAGAAHHNWQGGITKETERIRKSTEYKEWHKSVLKRDNYTCQECGTRKSPFHVDHIKPFCAYPELRLEITNGRTLCIPCHKRSETWGYKATLIKLQKESHAA